MKLMSTLVGVVVIAVAVTGIQGLLLRWAEMPFEVTDYYGTCLFEAHPQRSGGFIRTECGTTGVLVLAQPIRFDRFIQLER
jgi:hypothetical protein